MWVSNARTQNGLSLVRQMSDVCLREAVAPGHEWPQWKARKAVRFAEGSTGRSNQQLQSAGWLSDAGLATSCGQRVRIFRRQPRHIFSEDAIRTVDGPERYQVLTMYGRNTRKAQDYHKAFLTHHLSPSNPSASFAPSNLNKCQLLQT